MSTRRPCRNELLQRLSYDEYDKIAPYLTSIDFKLHDVLYLPDKRITHVYFVESGIISAVIQLKDGRTVESGLIGKEGMIGHLLLHNIDHSGQKYFAQADGQCLRMTAKEFHKYVLFGTPLYRIILQYSGVFATQVMQLAACNAVHKISDRCCRWLLMWEDRLGSNVLPITQEFLSHMLGVRRSSISEVLKPLREKGLISISRGRVTIVEKSQIEAHTCECYTVMKEYYNKFLPPLKHKHIVNNSLETRV